MRPQHKVAYDHNNFAVHSYENRLSNIRVRKWLAWLSCVACGICLLSGCGGMQRERMQEFGSLQRPGSTINLSGLGVHQRLWENAGAKCIMPTKLSPLLDDFEAIVLVGTTHAPPGREARDWLEEWLAQAEGRSVVYFGRDFDPETVYRATTMARVAAKDRGRAEVLWALSTAESFANKTTQFAQPCFCGWFLTSEMRASQDLRLFVGPWAETMSGKETVWPIAVSLDPPTDELRTRMRPTLIANFPAAPSKSPSQDVDEDEDMVYRSVWSREEINTPEDLDALWDDAPVAEILLAGGDEQNTPLVTRLTSDRFEGSQILIVANGAPFLNGSLVNPAMRRLSARIVQQCLPAKRVAFLEYGAQGILISHIQEQDPRLAGLELLTVWPLNVMVMHGALLGILACVVLLSVLGRPQAAPHRALSDFGEHVEAVGRMLLKTRDMAYAHRLIREYFRQIRKEPGPSWIPEDDGRVQIKIVPELVHSKEQSSTIPSSALANTEPVRGAGSRLT